MAVSMYAISVPIFVRHLNGLANCLKKAQALYGERKYDETTLLNYRLYPDMFNFTRQVQLATDHVRACVSQLAGEQAPKLAGDEGSLAQLMARVEVTVAWLNAIKPEQVEGTEGKSVTIKGRDRDTTSTGLEMLLNRSMPNFYFHTTTAYDILRHNGLEIGKRDFMGAS